MPLKKLMKGLEASLKVEREIHPSTLLGVWFHKFKMRSIQHRIDDIKKELNNRKIKSNG
jgi:putative IMPACT (imprinted ancient) family translation regulator